MALSPRRLGAGLRDELLDAAPYPAQAASEYDLAVAAYATAETAPPHGRRWFPKACVVAADLVTISVAVALSYSLRRVLPGVETVDYAPGRHLLLGALSLPIWVALFFHHGLYLGRKVSSRVEEFRGIVHAVGGGVLGIIVLAFILKLDVSRGWLVVMLFLATGLVTLEREVVRQAFASLRRRGRMLRPVIVVGDNTEALDLCSMLTSEPTLGYQVLGLIGDGQPASLATASAWSLLGEIDQTTEVVQLAGATGVILVTSAMGVATANRLVRELGTAGIHVEMSSPLADISATRLTVQPLGQSPVVYVEPIRLAGWRAGAKRALDLVVASVGLVVTSPILAVSAVAIRVRTGSPILFRQTRIGRGGQTFTMLKLRTMVRNAEDLQPEVMGQNQAGFPLFKIHDDPRTSSVGRVLRRFSIDELPQFWNVIRGHMSVVGPRPALPQEVASWTSDVHKRLQLKPGMTGMWQISGRRHHDFAEYTRWDLYYLDNWSLWTDVAIVAKTVPAVLHRRSGY